MNKTDRSKEIAEVSQWIRNFYLIDLKKTRRKKKTFIFLLKIEKKLLRPNNKSHKQQANTVCNLNEKTSQFIFLLIVRCAHALSSFFNTNKLSQGIDQSKLKFYQSIQADYRLKNFFCLYMLTDLIYEELASKSKNNHLFTSINSLRCITKVDDYFDLE